MSLATTMALAATCPTCGQTLREDRIGVRMSKLKTHIFGLIRRAGPGGIYIDDLYDLCLRERGAQRETLKVHVWQINEMLIETKFIIRRHSGSYALERRNASER